MIDLNRTVVDSQGNLVTVNNPSSDNLHYLPLDTSRHSYELLESIFSPTNSNVAYYGNGLAATPENLQDKIDFWGQRYESNNPLSCYFVFTDKSDDPIGFVNLGRMYGKANVLYDGDLVYAGGFLFNDSLNGCPLVTEAINSVYVDYAQNLYDLGILSSPAFVYPIKTTNPLYYALANSALSLMDLSIDSPEQACIIEAIASTENVDLSFNYETNTITENKCYNGSEVAMFYYLYDDITCGVNDL